MDSRDHSRIRSEGRGAFALFAVGLAIVAMAGVGTRSALPRRDAMLPGASAASPAQTPASPNKDIATEAEARAACGTACHKFPTPDILPRWAWRDALVRMVLIQDRLPEPKSGAHLIPLPPEYLPLQRYYEANAPERLEAPERWPTAGSGGRAAFERRGLTPPGASSMPAIANVRFFDIDDDGGLDIVATDMRGGLVLAGYSNNDYALETIAELRHPARLRQVDLDGDGLQDLLVTDLGSFQPADHDRGALFWLRQIKNEDGHVAFETIELASGLARTADARAADFNGDGKLDVLLGIFGWRYSGNVTLLENRTTSWDAPAFVPKVIEERTGVIDVPTVDLNRDGRPDFVALYAQEHEMVVAYINQGELEFTPHTLYAAPHPNWGFSGMQVVDLDQNGRVDLLLTHGDTFDDMIVKPYHGIQWLEQVGTLQFREHELAKLPGAQRAQAVDLDGDGDLDVVACAMLALGGGELEPSLASVVWLEQEEPGVFRRRTLEMGQPVHATLDVADINGNGRPDLVVGRFLVNRPLDAWLDLWENVTSDVGRRGTDSGPR